MRDPRAIGILGATMVAFGGVNFAIGYNLWTGRLKLFSKAGAEPGAAAQARSNP
jgi:hypothetical protein